MEYAHGASSHEGNQWMTLGPLVKVNLLSNIGKEIPVKSWVRREMADTCNQILYLPPKLEKLMLSTAFLQFVRKRNSFSSLWAIFPKQSWAQLQAPLDRNSPTLVSFGSLDRPHQREFKFTPTFSWLTRMLCCHLIRCGVPHGMNKYFPTTAY